MEDMFKCPNCGVEFEKTQAEEAGYHCGECGDKLVAQGVEEPARAGSSMANYVLLALILITIGATYWQVWGKGEGGSPARNEQFVDSILKSALKLNDKAPLMLDKSTRLDRIEVEGKKIIYISTLVNLTDESSRDQKLFKKGIKPFLVDKYCKDKNIGKALKLGVEYGHQYHGIDGTLLFTADVSIRDCPAGE